VDYLFIELNLKRIQGNLKDAILTLVKFKGLPKNKGVNCNRI